MGRRMSLAWLQSTDKALSTDSDILYNMHETFRFEMFLTDQSNFQWPTSSSPHQQCFSGWRHCAHLLQHLFWQQGFKRKFPPAITSFGLKQMAYMRHCVSKKKSGTKIKCETNTRVKHFNVSSLLVYERLARLFVIEDWDWNTPAPLPGDAPVSPSVQHGEQAATSRLWENVHLL